MGPPSFFIEGTARFFSYFMNETAEWGEMNCCLLVLNERNKDKNLRSAYLTHKNMCKINIGHSICHFEVNAEELILTLCPLRGIAWYVFSHFSLNKFWVGDMWNRFHNRFKLSPYIQHHHPYQWPPSIILASLKIMRGRWHTHMQPAKIFDSCFLFTGVSFFKYWKPVGEFTCTV